MWDLIVSVPDHCLPFTSQHDRFDHPMKEMSVSSWSGHSREGSINCFQFLSKSQAYARYHVCKDDQ